MKNQITTKVLSKVLKMTVILSVMLYTLPSLAQPACSAHFQNQPGNTLNSVKFTAAMNSPTTHYFWDFGDGVTSTQLNPVHTYASAGVYYACLSIKDSSMHGVCSDSWCDSIHIGKLPPPPPACDAHFNFKPDSALNTLNFNSAFNPSGSTYSWNFGDGNTSTLKNPSETFPDTGIYYVCLTVSDSLGTCTNTWCDSVRIGNCIHPHPLPPPYAHCNAHFKFHGDSILFDIRFQSALNKPGTTYSWDFGDGNTSNSANPNNTYTSAGVYYVCLTVNDSACTDTWCDSVRVGLAPPPPQPPHIACDAHFKYNGDSTQTVKFFSAPNSPTATYSWDFGDGNTGTGNNPVHSYSVQGVYWVCLTVNDSTPNGPCSNTWCDSVRSDRRFPKPGQPCPFSKINASVFPNPMTDNSSIHIDNSSGNVTFRVFDHNGRVAVIQQLGNGDYRLSKENLGTGIHFYEILDSDGNVTTGKFIVQ